MSIQAVGWVLDESRSRGVDRLVLISLANHCDERLTAWPSVRTIAREAGVATNTVMAAVRRLVELGELEVVEAGDARKSSVYRITKGNGGVSDVRHPAVDNPSEGCRVSETQRRDQRRVSETQRLKGVSPRARQNQEPTTSPQPPLRGGADEVDPGAELVDRILAAATATDRPGPRRDAIRARLRPKAERLAALFPTAPLPMLAGATRGEPAPNLAHYRTPTPELV